MDDWFKKRMKELGYKECRNCAHQIEPMRSCEWLERGGDGVVHLICPRWERRLDDRPKMTDLISRQAAIDALHTHFKDGFEEDRWWNSTHVLVAIKEVPSAQPEIIRCIDCKWSYDDVGGRICSYGVCVDCVISDDFYCADAERRTDETD